MISELQYYTSTDTDPYKNLATEKFLFDNVSDTTCILYLWQNQKTVVIGKNQNPWAECNCNILSENGGKLARRLSGGGAVFHDLGNLNFTFISSAENMDIRKNLKVIQAACRMAGIETEISGRNDILADGKKFSGNAFYNSKGKAYHHGTLLINSDTEEMTKYLTPSKAKLEAKGVKSVKSRVVNLFDLVPELNCDIMKEYMLSAFKEVFGLLPTQINTINESDIQNDIDRFSSWEFLYGSTIPFSVSFEKRFDWGTAQLLLQVADGIIQSSKLYTDALDCDLSVKVETALQGCRFECTEIKKSLAAQLSVALTKDFLNLIINNKE